MNPNQTAFLSLDLQKGILGNHPAAEASVVQASKALDFARKQGAMIIHVGLGFAAGHPEIPDSQPMFSMLKKNNVFVIGTESAAFDPRTIKDGELVIHKQRISAFSENRLNMILRANEIKELVLFGVATSGIVLSTVRQAFDLDYKVTVIEDACYDPDPEVHQVLCRKVFARTAKVTTVAELLGAQK